MVKKYAFPGPDPEVHRDDSYFSNTSDEETDAEDEDEDEDEVSDIDSADDTLDRYIGTAEK